MFNICAKSLLRCQPLRQTYRILAIQNYATFGVRDVLYETSDEAGTLLTRFAKHVALERQKICEQVPTEVKYSNYFPISDMRYFQNELHKTAMEQIAAVVIFAYTYRSNADPAKFAIILNELDRHAYENVDEMDMDTLLRTLYAFLFLIPNWMTRLDFYGSAMNRLFREFGKDGGKSKEQFVQLCFYMGLSKKQTKFNVNGLLNSLLDANLNQYLKEMNTLDMALVSNAAYKTATAIKNEEFNQRLLKEVVDISTTSNGNDALLITFIKTMRFQRLRSPLVCEYIKNICQDVGKLQQLQARGQVHLFAYLADNLWDCKECTEPLIETFSQQLKRPRHSNFSYGETVRGKDIATFLWSCAQLNCNLSSTQIRTIENSLLDKLHGREFNYFADQLVEACLCLWILGFKSKELLDAAIQLKSDSLIKRKQPKVDSRLTVLLSAVHIEETSWRSNAIKGFQSFNLEAKVPSYLLNAQDVPYQEIISQLLKEENVSSANLACPINGINIPGIHVKFSSPPENEVFVEFLTPSQTLNFSQEPVAILRLKLRLLQSLGHKVKLLTSADVLDQQNLKGIINDIVTQEEENIKGPSENSITA